MPAKPLPSAGTPQFRTLPIRKLKNLYPERRIEIADLPNGVTFQLFNADDVAFGQPVTIYAYQRMPLTRSELKRRIKWSAPSISPPPGA